MNDKELEELQRELDEPEEIREAKERKKNVVTEGALRGYLRRNDAARYLGVSNSILSSWAKKGKIKSYQHPITYRVIYKKTDLEEIIDNIRLINPNNPRFRGSF